MRKIFLDVGAFDGTSVKFFRDNYPTADQFEIYCFEPFPVNIEKLKEVENIAIIPKAAWSSDGEIPLYIGKAKSCTMYADKSTGRVTDQYVIVPTIDLARFIKGNFKKEDEIWIKMNVEGAEYEIIPHLYKEGLIDWFDRMYIRWHNNKIPSLQDRHEDVKAMVPNATFVWRKKVMLPL